MKSRIEISTQYPTMQSEVTFSGEVANGMVAAMEALTKEWQERALAAEALAAEGVSPSLMRALQSELAEANSQLHIAGVEIGRLMESRQLLRDQLDEYRGQGGTINMERSWKTKYRRALSEANQRLVDAGLDPVRIRRLDPEVVVSTTVADFDFEEPCR
jgi:predicted  nucleic acid-binding Zn-ribbon protein